MAIDKLDQPVRPARVGSRTDRRRQPKPKTKPPRRAPRRPGIDEFA